MRKNFILVMVAVTIFVLELFYISTRLNQKLTSIEAHQKDAKTSIQVLDRSIVRIGQTTSFLNNRSTLPFIYLASKPLQTTTLLAKR